MKAQSSRKRAPFIALALLSAVLLLSACDLLLDFEEGALDLVEIVGPLPTDLSDSEDPMVRAAGQTTDATKIEANEWEEKAEADLPGLPEDASRADRIERQLTIANRAVDLAPTNVDLRVRQVTAQVMVGEDPTDLKAQAIYVIDKFSVSDRTAQERFLDEYIQLLYPVARLNPEAGDIGAEASSRVRAELCAQYEIYERDFPSEFSNLASHKASYGFGCFYPQ